MELFRLEINANYSNEEMGSIIEQSIGETILMVRSVDDLIEDNVIEKNRINEDHNFTKSYLVIGSCRKGRHVWCYFTIEMSFESQNYNSNR